jgi:hypothetical protein
MGACPLSAQEVSAWAALSGHRINPFEFASLLLASRAYVQEYFADNPSPPDDDPAVKHAAAGKFTAFAKQLKRT